MSWMFLHRNRKHVLHILSKNLKRVRSCAILIYPSLIHTFCSTIHRAHPSILSIFVLSRGSSFLVFCQRSDGRVTYVALSQSRWQLLEKKTLLTNMDLQSSHPFHHISIPSLVHPIYPFTVCLLHNQGFIPDGKTSVPADFGWSESTL